jgi:Hint module
MKAPTLTPIQAPTTAPVTVPTTAPITCFAGTNMVEVQDRGYIPMHRLRIGDMVKSGSGAYDANKVAFTQVYGFGHLDYHRDETFVQIGFDRGFNTSSNDLYISPHHLVFVKRHHHMYPVRAKDIKVGDILLGTAQEQHLVVLTIQMIRQRGIFAPLTQSGDIVVNGIIASNYVDVLHGNKLVWFQHNLGHAMFYPQRSFCYYFIETCKKEGYVDGYGYLSYIIVSVSMMVRNTIACMTWLVPGW